MTETDAGFWTSLLLLACVLGAAVTGWWADRRDWSRSIALGLVGGLGVTALVAALAAGPGSPGTGQVVAVVVLSTASAVLGGGPMTTAVFGLVDRGETPDHSVRQAGDVLRGGAWIGALERAAIHVALLAGWPEGLAITLAIKGLGRYPELRHQEHPGIAERFLIGTFVSVLWAAACAGVALLLIG